MRKALWSFVLALGLGAVFAAGASAQINLGLTGGVNSASLTGNDVDGLDLSSKTGGAGGVYLNISLGQKLAVEGQLLYASQGFDAPGGSVTQSYVEFPALLKFYFGGSGPKFNIFAGPSVSWQIDCNVNASTVSGNCDTSNIGDPNTSVWSGIAGLGIQFGRLGVEAHYQSGFSDTFSGVDATYGVWSLMGRFAILGSR
jgi:hypothetical protein